MDPKDNAPDYPNRSSNAIQNLNQQNLLDEKTANRELNNNEGIAGTSQTDPNEAANKEPLSNKIILLIIITPVLFIILLAIIAFILLGQSKSDDLNLSSNLNKETVDIEDKLSSKSIVSNKNIEILEMPTEIEKIFDHKKNYIENFYKTQPYFDENTKKKIEIKNNQLVSQEIIVTDTISGEIAVYENNKFYGPLFILNNKWYITSYIDPDIEYILQMDLENGEITPPTDVSLLLEKVNNESLNLRTLGQGVSFNGKYFFYLVEIFGDKNNKDYKNLQKKYFLYDIQNNQEKEIKLDFEPYLAMWSEGSEYLLFKTKDELYILYEISTGEQKYYKNQKSKYRVL